LQKRLLILVVLVSSLFLAALPIKGEKSLPPKDRKIKKIKAFIVRVQFVEEATMTVTAYYSPLRGQKRYVTGSYEKEIKLQGQGKASRDGTKPYLGMLAADWRYYPPGTKIFVPGYTNAIGHQAFSTVHDTGGAIKNNRLDVWMGWGDQGRKRALKWGIKKIKCKILREKTQVFVFDD